MTKARVFLVEALRRIANGGDIDNTEVESAVPDPFVLDPAEKRAWQELSHWADDDDIRARKPRYAILQRERMRDRLSELNGDDG